MNKYQITNRNFGVEIEFQKKPGVTQQQILRLLEDQDFQTRSAGYEHTQGQTSKGTLKPDGSLAASGLELVSPILHGHEDVEAVRKVVNLLTQVGYVDSRCGLNVHHEVGKTADRIQKRTIRNVYRVYKSAQDAINELIVDEPLMEKVIQRKGLELGICCHPYDICTEMIARKMGVLITGKNGELLRSRLSVEPDVTWVGYANQSIRDQIEPLIQEALQHRGLLS